MPPIERRSGSTFVSTPTVGSALGPYNCQTVTVYGPSVISEFHATNPMAESTSVLGTVIKTMETGNIESDHRAAEVVLAELERMRGERKDPTLEARQLTTAFWFASTVYLPVFVIYKPSAMQ
ncbi:MAG: hypothetical protein PHV13_03765 [Candidatus ainarchaeum sp.]|nr:hypothetical protein [Candidatus ainarchaeum sp.]